jgi:plasmid maintenance system antidote protein VapI
MKIDVDALARLRALVKQEGSQKNAAMRLGCHPVHVGDLLKGRRTFSDSMLARLGLRRTVIVDESQREKVS